MLKPRVRHQVPFAVASAVVLALGGGDWPSASAATIAVNATCGYWVVTSQTLTSGVVAGDILAVTYGMLCREVQVATSLTPATGTTGAPVGTLYTLDGSGSVTFNVVSTPAAGSTLVDFGIVVGPDHSYVLQGVTTEPTQAVAPPPPTFNLAYNGNGGSCLVSSGSALSGSWLNLPTTTDCSRSGFTLSGWNTSSDGSGLGFAPGGPTVMSGDNTVYAIWTKHAAPVATGSGSGTAPGATSTSAAVVSRSFIVLVKWRFAPPQWQVVEGDAAALEANPACFTIVADSQAAVSEAMIKAARELAATYHGTYSGIVQSKDWAGAHLVAAYQK